VKDIAATASKVAHDAMEPELVKPDDEVVVMPMAVVGFVIILRRTNALK
jgi:hypothetical protein